ncbi:hypothetical protein FRX31_015405 [Thalictrum thalictroides]|uniref:Uncharacterized protein n=1 Tax=Thalictrum thalictroides TaxID=46969 RepID=A0A7J6WDQ6_THATH|nr:hypothetical protein FRX31_015405 [Thalictrum thalictroides]
MMEAANPNSNLGFHSPCMGVNHEGGKNTFATCGYSQERGKTTTGAAGGSHERGSSLGDGKGDSNSVRSGSPTGVSSCSQPDSQEAVGKKSWDERVDIEDEKEVVGSTKNKDDAAKGKPITVGLNGVDRPAMG